MSWIMKNGPPRLDLTFFFLAVTTLTPVAAQQSAAQDVLSGHWKLDRAKSSFSPGPTPKSQTLEFEADAGLVKLTLLQDGKLVASSKFRFDGKQYPVYDSPGLDALSAKIGDSTGRKFVFQVQWSSGSKALLFCNGVAQDGMLLTIVTTGNDNIGRPVHNSRVFIKQK